MQTAHAIVADIIKTNAIDTTEFYAWFQDGGYSENEANIHDARYLDLLGQFVAERDDPDASNADAPAAVLPRILNKHTHGIPAGAVYIGRGSPWGNPFVIGRDGTRAEVIAKYEAWLDTQPQLLARLPELKGRGLVCFCFPKSCHGEGLRRRANAPVYEPV